MVQRLAPLSCPPGWLLRVPAPVRCPHGAEPWYPPAHAHPRARHRSTVQRAGAMCRAGLKALTFAVAFFTTNQPTVWHKSCCTSNLGQPARDITPSTRWPPGKPMALAVFHFPEVSCNCSCIRALEIPGQCCHVWTCKSNKRNRPGVQQMVFCLSQPPQGVSSEENKLGAIDLMGLKWWLLCHFPR